MIATSDLEAIARSRLKEAKALLKSRHYDGAAYLCGYAIEVALKANEFFEKIKRIGSEIDAEVGGVVLFGVFKPAETPRWDVIISADWVDESEEIEGTLPLSILRPPVPLSIKPAPMRS